MLHVKIVKIETKIVDLTLLKPFKVAIGTLKSFQTLIVRIHTDTDLIGYGEACPISFVTGESIAICQSVIESLKPQLIGQEVARLEHIHALMDSNYVGNYVGNYASKAAIDLALHDLLAQQAKLPLYKYLGGGQSQFEIDKTIAIETPEIMAQEAKKIVAEGINVLKIKVGLNAKQDIERIAQIRQAVGPDIAIRIDANQGWNTAEAIQTINAMAQYDIESVEQPLKYWDFNGHKLIRQQITTPLMADESLFSPMDAIKLVREDCADIFNIKLMKCGGLYKAAQINSIGQNAGISCMVGCMLESWVGITAAASFIAAKNNVTKADIDSVLHIHPNEIKSDLRFENGQAILSDSYGLGITMDW